MPLLSAGVQGKKPLFNAIEIFPASHKRMVLLLLLDPEER
jgi:hypothetical protein